MILQAAIFPLPEIVALPGSSMQLHVFEPRFRRMVRDCVAMKRPIGIALGTLTSPRRAHGRDSLNENQETYHPAPVFGVGELAVQIRLPDGRYLVEVAVQHRGRLVEVVQEVPYLLANVEILPPDTGGDAASNAVFEGLLTASDSILETRGAAFRAYFIQENGRARRLGALVYSILQWFQVGPQASQSLLEDDSDLERGMRLLGWMNRYVSLTQSTCIPPKIPDPIPAPHDAAKVLPFRRSRRGRGELHPH
jgi:Lon protease-like protein